MEENGEERENNTAQPINPMLYHPCSIHLLYGLKTLQAILHMPFHLHTNTENIIFPKSLLVS